MYTRYFGLKEKPFAIPPNPRYLYMSELHREAFAHLTYGISSDGCFILLTGEVGTGKTTICRCLLDQLPEKTDVALILNPKLNSLELLESICEELKIPQNDAPPSTKKYIDQLNHYLLQSFAEGRNTALIIDEAQNLDIDVLEQLRLLTNLETNTAKLLRIVLIGQTELREILNKPELRQLKQRVTSRYHLTALQPQEVKTYIQHRITVAGGGRTPLFTDRAIKLIIKLTKSLPRLINILCDRALLGAYAENEECVNKLIVTKAGEEIFFHTKDQKKSKTLIYASLVCALISIVIMSTLFISKITNRETTQSLPPDSTTQQREKTIDEIGKDIELTSLNSTDTTNKVSIHEIEVKTKYSSEQTPEPNQ